VRRVFLRSGLADRDEAHHIVAAARIANPDRPGALDLPAWEIGRTWCRPRAPDCAGCPIGAVCPRLFDRASDVRGA
jgi:endonuclease III